MSSTAFAPVPLFVSDYTSKTENGYHGTFDIITKPSYGEGGTKIIGNVIPYGGERFCTHEEAKAYANLFAASPDMIAELKANHEFLLMLYSSINTYGNAVNLDQIQTDMRDRMAKQLTIINKATT